MITTKHFQRTAMLISVLKLWCAEKHGRQAQASKILCLGGSTLRDWLSGRRQPTGEQALALSEFLRTVAAYGPPVEPVESDDPLVALHAGLESPDTKNVWIRRNLGTHHHVILGGDQRDLALERIEAFLKKGGKS